MATDIIARGMAEEALTHFVAGSNIVIQDESDGTQSINASGSVSANDDVARANIANHIAEENNPHSVTKAQVGLGNCNNTSDLDKPISTATQTALDGKSNERHTHTVDDITNFPESIKNPTALTVKLNGVDKAIYDGSEAKSVNVTPADISAADRVHTHDDRYYTETEIDGLLEDKSDVGHTHTKSEITDFPTSMPASDVSAWAKASIKPTYTASEVGALPDTTIVPTADDKTISYNDGVLTANYIGENLLDNPDFSINQRSSTSAVVGEYIADRWKVTAGTVTRTDNGITLNGTMIQKLENAIGTATTTSVIMQSGTANASYDDSTKTLTLTSAGGIIKAVKLESGNVSTSFIPPNPATELAKCQRYFKRIGTGISGVWQNTNALFLSCPFAVKMRPNITPTMSLNTASVSAHITATGEATTTTATIGGIVTSSGIDWCCVSGFTNGIDGRGGSLAVDCIDISADL